MKVMMSFFICSTILLISCKSQIVKYDDFKGDMITIGKGGGFTGAYDEYAVLENGYVYKYNSITKERIQLGKLKDDFTKQIFKNYQVLKLADLKVNSPGNMNYFVEFKNEKTKYKSIWSDQSETHSDLILFYKTVMNYLTKSLEK